MIKPIISQEAFDGLENIRSSGTTNMLDYPKVLHLSNLYGFEATANWLTDHKGEYGRGIFFGFEVENDPIS